MNPRGSGSPRPQWRSLSSCERCVPSADPRSPRGLRQKLGRTRFSQEALVPGSQRPDRAESFRVCRSRRSRVGLGRGTVPVSRLSDSSLRRAMCARHSRSLNRSPTASVASGHLPCVVRQSSTAAVARPSTFNRIPGMSQVLGHVLFARIFWVGRPSPINVTAADSLALRVVIPGRPKTMVWRIPDWVGRASSTVL